MNISGSSSSSNNMAGRSNRNRAASHGDGDEPLHIDLNVNNSEETWVAYGRGFDPYTRMILGQDTCGGSSSSMSNHIDLNDAGAATRRRRHSPTSYLSSLRNISFTPAVNDETAGPSSGGLNPPHPLKREGPEEEDADDGVGIRIGASSSSDQRNVRQRFSSENQPNLSQAAHSNYAESPSGSTRFARQLPSLSTVVNEGPIYPATTEEDEYYEDCYNDITPLRVVFPSGGETGEVAYTRPTYWNSGLGFDGSNASSSAWGGRDGHFSAQTFMLSPDSSQGGLQLGGGTSGNNNQFGRNAGHVQGGDFHETPPIFGLNRRGEPLTGAALVRRSNTISAPPMAGEGITQPNSFARYMGDQTLLGNSRSHRSGPPPIVDSVSDWLPTYLPALEPEPTNWPASDFMPVIWDDDFEEDEDAEDEELMQYSDENMAYEELLELEDRIGDVDTGLSEETIKAKLKPKKYSCFKVGPPGDDGICCICQEGYEEGEMISRLSCRHEFHFDCIKQWLLRKNLCPICKKTAVVI